MTNELLDITGKVDRATVELFNTVDRLTRQLQIRYIVVGATARDLVMHYGYDTRVQRATRDIDFGIEVPHWSAFDTLKTHLIAAGFTETRTPHRFRGHEQTPIDIVPFGGVESETASIAWPPTGEVKMNVLGFQEACDHATLVRLENKDDRALDIPVVSPPGMAILKLIAWTDRDQQTRRKDAADLFYLLKNYGQVPHVFKSLYGAEYGDITEMYDWDTAVAGAHVLGIHAAAIARPATRNVIKNLYKATARGDDFDQLTDDMTPNFADDSDQARHLLAIFLAGFEHSY